MNYFKIFSFLQKGEKSFFDFPVEKQKVFLEKLGYPQNDIDRSYKQYRCQHFFVPNWKKAFYGIISCVLFPFLLIYLLLAGLFVRKNKKVDAIMENRGLPEIVPTILSNRYNLEYSCWEDGLSLSFNDLCFVWRIFVQAPLHPYFTMKSMMTVARYSSMIRKYHPSVIIRHAEYSFSSSLLTEYCHRFNVKHLNVMHGEKLFFIRDAFFHFDECYVWSDHYKKLFTDLKAEPSQFVVALPPSMSIDTKNHYNKLLWADYKYYLGPITESEFKSIVDSMSFVYNEGKTIKYRVHPRHANIDLMTKYVDVKEIEMPKEVSIIDSISNCDNVVGSYSTVLNQAFFAGKRVVLDDVTFKNQYNKLLELRYLLIGEKCDILSEHQNK